MPVEPQCLKLLTVNKSKVHRIQTMKQRAPVNKVVAI